MMEMSVILSPMMVVVDKVFYVVVGTDVFYVL